MASILNFHVYRSGTDVYANISVKPTSISGISGATLHVEYSSSKFDDALATIKDIGSAFGVTNLTIVGKSGTVNLGTFSEDSNVYFTLYFSDGRYNAAPARSVLFSTVTPLMVGKNNYGVSIGGVPVGSATSPRFTSYWPAAFKGGVETFGGSWIDLSGSLGSAVSAIGTSLRCKKVADKYIIDGIVQVKPGSSTVVLATLPEGWYPQDDVFALAPCEGTDNPRVARIVVGGTYSENRGKLCLSWVKNIKDGSTYTSDTIWVQCNIEYYDAGGDAG